MLGRLLSLPLIVLVLGLGAGSMLVPAIHAAAVNDHHTARVFFYGAVLVLILFLMIAIATAGRAGAI